MAGPDTVPVRTVHGVRRVGRRAVGTPVVLAVGVVVLLLVAVLARDHLPAVSAVQGAVQARVLQLRSLGPGLPVAFVLAHAVVTVTPAPRTTFTLAAGVLFGPVVGVALTVLGATASAVLALLLLVRAVGRDARRSRSSRARSPWCCSAAPSAAGAHRGCWGWAPRAGWSGSSASCSMRAHPSSRESCLSVIKDAHLP